MRQFINIVAPSKAQSLAELDNRLRRLAILIEGLRAKSKKLHRLAEADLTPQQMYGGGGESDDMTAQQMYGGTSADVSGDNLDDDPSVKDFNTQYQANRDEYTASGRMPSEVPGNPAYSGPTYSGTSDTGENLTFQGTAPSPSTYSGTSDTGENLTFPGTAPSSSHASASTSDDEDDSLVPSGDDDTF